MNSSQHKELWVQWIANEETVSLALTKYISRGILKANSEDTKSHIRKAVHNLDFAKEILGLYEDKTQFKHAGETFYDWEIIASYYAIYHTCLALVASKGYASKSHAATLCAIIKFFYHGAKRLNAFDIHAAAQMKELGEKYIEEFVRMKSDREGATYNISIEFQRGIAERNRKKAIDFVNKVKSILEDKKWLN